MMLTVAGWAMAMGGFAVALLVLREHAAQIDVIQRTCHELRGPLTVARLGLALGLRNGSLSAERLRAIDFELSRAGLAIDDLAGGRRTEARSREWVDLRELLADSVEAWRPAAEAAGVAIELTWRGAPAGVVGDRLRIAQATDNLIANAIEHGQGTVRVSGRLHVGRVRLEVVDSGRGLTSPLSELGRSARRGRRGRGLGLAIAGDIVQAHGGTLASGPSDAGARFVIDLPAAPPDASKVEPPVA